MNFRSTFITCTLLVVLCVVCLVQTQETQVKIDYNQIQNEIDQFITSSLNVNNFHISNTKDDSYTKDHISIEYLKDLFNEYRTTKNIGTTTEQFILKSLVWKMYSLRNGLTNDEENQQKTNKFENMSNEFQSLYTCVTSIQYVTGNCESIMNEELIGKWELTLEKIGRLETFIQTLDNLLSQYELGKHVLINDDYSIFEPFHFDSKPNHDLYNKWKNEIDTFKNSIPSSKDGEKVPFNIAVVGLGPVGLLNSLEIMLYNQYYKSVNTNMKINLFMIEKRETYMRNVWFDIYERPYSIGMRFMKKTGFWNLDSEKVVHEKDEDNDQVDDEITIRCNILERYLSKLVWIISGNSNINTEFKYGYDYKKFCDAFPDNATSNTVSSPFLIVSNKDSKVKSSDVNCADTSNIANTTENIPFDLLIATDGKNSKIRSHSNIKYESVDKLALNEQYMKNSKSLEPFSYDKKLNSNFHIQTNNKTLIVKDLHQIGIIINYKNKESIDKSKPNNQYRFESTNKCLELSNGPEDAESWNPEFEIEGASSIFARFFYGHCHLQVLLTYDHGRSIYNKYDSIMKVDRRELAETLYAVNDDSANSVSQKNTTFNNSSDIKCQQFLKLQDEAIPWDYMMQISNVMYEHEFTSIEELKEFIQMKPSKSVPGCLEYDIIMLNITMNASSSNYHMVENYEKDKGSVLGSIVLNGDASALAHFRLGVGINNAFFSVGELGRLFVKMIKWKYESLDKMDTNENNSILVHENVKQQLNNAVLEREAETSERYGNLIGYQASTIFYENYCDFVLYFNDHLYSSDILEKDYHNYEHNYIEDQRSILTKCFNNILKRV